MLLFKNIFLYSLVSLALFACKGGEESIGTSVDKTNSVTQETTTTKTEPQLTEPTVGLNLGNKAPDISLKNSNDTAISLSSIIKGRLVLVDFWASWCGPCRHENPVVVQAYNTYKDKNFKGGTGFTIYSVSLDNDKGRWKQAIEKDGLIWPYHVSDLKMWASEVVPKYNIIGIPTNVLVNENGVIIAKNLRGEELEAMLKKLEKK